MSTEKNVSPEPKVEKKKTDLSKVPLTKPKELNLDEEWKTPDKKIPFSTRALNQKSIDFPASTTKKTKANRLLLKSIEQHWITNFHLMCSKDNEHLPKYRREFFDNPLAYDVNGTRT